MPLDDAVVNSINFHAVYYIRTPLGNQLPFHSILWFGNYHSIIYYGLVRGARKFICRGRHVLLIFQNRPALTNAPAHAKRVRKKSILVMKRSSVRHGSDDGLTATFRNLTAALPVSPIIPCLRLPNAHQRGARRQAFRLDDDLPCDSYGRNNRKSDCKRDSR